MKVHLEDINDDIFAALWVANNGKEKKDLNYVNGVGITNPEIIHDILTQYRSFQFFMIHENIYKRYENFFNINFCIVLRKSKKRITFSYKSDSWHRMIFLLNTHNNSKIEYIKFDFNEIFPLLTKEDSFVNLPLKDIFDIYGRPSLDIPLTEETHDEWQNHASINLMVYQLIDGKIDLYKSRLTLAARPYDEMIRLIAVNPSGYEEV